MEKRLGRHVATAESDFPHVNRSQNTHQSCTVKQDQVSNTIRVVYTKHPNRVSRTTSRPNTRDEMCTPVTVVRLTGHYKSLQT
ncbi:hypothetical protein DPMN_161983 [Dreissena polymorpha]|uniref:Uncharacterized protein n=1 Tax=Dreissena polymorpha TaxID=45954 RepID=A0A9D4ITT8_DREPO|nr:hypothetical protein DPMN_161898 [Dreissena polymorpha]KAH3784033.1 hypothetical protein DPMN_161983 [Dreissena polymorpha]